MDLTGKRILVTGASSGIGRATAQLLSQLGADLVLFARNPERLEQTLQSLKEGSHTSMVFDLSDVDNIPSLLKDIVQETGPLSGIFHSAGGVEMAKPVNLLKEKYIDEILGATLKASMLLVRGLFHKKVRAEGMCSIVLMSSVMSVTGQSGLSLYSASKGSIDAAVRSMACELVQRNIRINSIVAGAVETEMHQRVSSNMSAETFQKYQDSHLMGFGQVEDIANAAAFLLSDASKWITGTGMVVDGGYTCR